MAEAGLFIGWGETVRGREQRALEVFNEGLQYYGRLHQEGRIESWELVLLEPHGGDLSGFILLRGTREQMHAVEDDAEFRRLTQRAIFIVDSVGVVPAILGEGIGETISIYQEEAAALR